MLVLPAHLHYFIQTAARSTNTYGLYLSDRCERAIKFKIPFCNSWSRMINAVKTVYYHGRLQHLQHQTYLDVLQLWTLLWHCKIQGIDRNR